MPSSEERWTRTTLEKQIERQRKATLEQAILHSAESALLDYGYGAHQITVTAVGYVDSEDNLTVELRGVDVTKES